MGDEKDTGVKNVNDFTFGKVLGEGSYGAVVLGKENKSGREFAIKMLEQKKLVKENKTRYATTERDLLRKCGNHPGIVRLFYTFKDDRYLYYVMELCSNGELLSHIKKIGGPISQETVSFYSAQLVLSLEYLHGLHIIHRDLKPENVLLDSFMNAKLTDFGTAKDIGSPDSPDSLDSRSRSNSFVGTAEYVSPELVKEKWTCPASDLWALGCIIYQMMCGRPPFRGPTEFAVMQLVSQVKYEFPNGFPADARSIIESLLVEDPDKRLGAGEGGYAALKAHPFFAGIGWDTLLDSTKRLTPPPPFVPSQISLVFPSDALTDANSQRKKVLEEEAEALKKRGFLGTEEVVLESGLVWKRRGRSVKKRQLILTNNPRIFYIDPKKMQHKGEVPWSANLRAEAKNNVAWFIHTPKRTYILEDISGSAQRWVDAINKQLDIYITTH